MAHTLFGYQIENGKVVINKEELKQLQHLFRAYLSGLSLANAAKEAEIKRNHGGITRILTDERYLGTDIFPTVISKELFEKVKIERYKRAKKLGRLNKKQEETPFEIPTFTLPSIDIKHDNPYKQAEYVYSLIESVVN